MGLKQGYLMGRSKRLNEQGFAAITVTMVIMVLLILITIGFARLISREQRQAIDRQLSTQAFYAAESGVNDAVEALTDTNPATRYTDTKSNCEPDGSTHFPPGSNILEDNVEYSCLLIDPAPFQLEYQAVGTVVPTVVPINGVDPSDGVTPRNIASLWIGWENETETPVFRTAPFDRTRAFPRVTDWDSGAAGVLRTALTPVNTARLSRDELISNTFTTFLYPQAAPSPGVGATTYTTAVAQQGQIIDGRCHQNNKAAPTRAPRYCSVRINGLNGLATSRFMLSLRMIYNNASIGIRAYDSGGNQLRLAEAQALVDSTGKAGDVLRRIAVRVPSRNVYDFAGFGLESAGELCKRYSVVPDVGVLTPETIRGGCTD